ncbi:hypothetical protein [Novosphingobium sp.]|uniref:hypothetical protein n=1 Tax=Novosphingobium sp. TaxID=1874826 RepID=UPI003340A73B
MAPHNTGLAGLIGRRQLLAGGAACAGALVLPGRALADCIAGNNGLLGPAGTWRVFQNAQPPADNAHDTASTYPTFPCTDAFSWRQDVNAGMNTSTWTGGNGWMYVWANRANKVAKVTAGNQFLQLKPNPIQNPTPIYNNLECRVEYTTVAKANAATRSLIRYWLGRADYAQPWIDAGGLASDFVFYSHLLDYPERYFTRVVTAQNVSYQVMTDIPWLPSTIVGGQGSFTRATMMSGNQARVPGIVLDYEVNDYRSNQVTTLFLNAVAADIHGAGAKLFLWTNPLNRTANTHGLDFVNLPAIVTKTCDLTSVQLWSGNTGENVAQSYQNQIAMIKGYACNGTVPYDRLVVVLDLKTTLADAQFVNNLLRGPAASNPQALCFWRNGLNQGGACGTTANNQIIAALEGTAALGIAPVAPTALPTGWSPLCRFP